MADPRFFDNRGPFDLKQICDAAGIEVPTGVDGSALVHDVAGLEGAGPTQLTFFSGSNSAAAQYERTSAGFCFVVENEKRPAPLGCVAIACVSVQHAFAAAGYLFYPQSGLAAWTQDVAIDPSAKLGQ